MLSDSKLISPDQSFISKKRPLPENRNETGEEINDLETNDDAADNQVIVNNPINIVDEEKSNPFKYSQITEPNAFAVNCLTNIQMPSPSAAEGHFLTDNQTALTAPVFNYSDLPDYSTEATPMQLRANVYRRGSKFKNITFFSF